MCNELIIVLCHVVPEPPTIFISPSGPIQGAMVGSPQDISCTAITPTLLDVVFNWTGPNGSIVDDSRVTISQTVVNGDNYTSVLQFAYLMEGDEGNYTCVVSLLSVNNSGSVEISPLTGQSPLTIIDITSTLTVELCMCVSYGKLRTCFSCDNKI